MLNPEQKPVIFLAFADPTGKLRNLARELRKIREVLSKAEKAGLCQLVERTKAAIKDIWDVFQDERYKDRIAIFHYGGHADCYKLLLETFAGAREFAFKEGLASYLAQQKGLKLIFLNACSTQQHAWELKQAGIPAVIGTSQKIDDQVATQLAIRFYSGIANGFTLKRAWLEAEAYIKTWKGESNFNAMYHWSQQEKHEDLFPWNIVYKEGAEEVKEWTLSDAAHNPLFGLPPIPQKDKLPEKPFLFLNRYEKKHAEIFFGRSYAVRELYDLITDKTSLPIILLYGQSGVGKSSLLEAGLLPRLGKSYTIRYKRRNQEKGLLGTLEEILDNELLSVKTDIKNPTIGNKWKLIEFKNRIPLVIILDQVEEVYTRPTKNLADEFEKFMEALKTLFKSPMFYPKGKLILGYRKEYHPEIEEQFKKEELERKSLFLQPLNRQDIIEVVTGLTCTQRLQDRYNLEVQDQLPVIIADDLLEDRDSPVAPALQIILTKMWDNSKTNDIDPDRKFTIEQYQALRKKGLLMTDFFNQQMAELRGWNPDVVDSGLALDVLKFHTTELGTARIRDIEEIRRTYPDRQDIIDDLIKKLKDIYLLTDTKQGKKETSLAHDTLAPIVIKEYNESDRPGQRAARILGAKIEDFRKNSDEVWLNEADLKIVEDGRQGMRILDDKEEELLEKSRERKLKLHREKRKVQIFRGLSIIVIVILIVLVYRIERVSSEKQRKEKADNLATQARLHLEKDPTISLRLVEKVRQLNKDSIEKGFIYKIYRENSFYRIIAQQDKVMTSVAFSPDGKYILTASYDGRIRLWNLQAKQLLNFKAHNSSVTCTAFSADGKYFITGSRYGTARLWDFTGNKLLDLKGHKGWILTAAISPGGKTILTGSIDKTAYLWDLRGEKMQDFTGHNGRVHSVAFSPDGQYILTGSEDKTARLWDWQGKELHVYRGHEAGVKCAVFSPDSQYILTGSEDKTARLWELAGKERQIFKGHKGGLTAAAFSPDGKYILTGSEDKTVRLWDLTGKKRQIFKGHNNSLISIAFSPDNQYILTGSKDRTIRYWKMRGREIQDFTGHEDQVYAAAFSPDGKDILTGTKNEIVRVWNREGNQLQVIKGYNTRVTAAAFSPNGKLFLTGTRDGTLRLWDLKGNELYTFRAHPTAVFSAAFSPDSQNILTGSYDNIARLWDLKGNKLQEFKGHEASVTAAAFSPDGRYVLTGSEDKTVRLWNLKGRERRCFRGHQGCITAAAFSPDSQYILTGSEDRTARLWDKQGNEQQRFQGHQDPVTAVAFSPDNRYILTGSRDKTARLWDWQGNQQHCFRGHESGITAVAFSPDGQYALTGSLDKTARLWKIFMSLDDFLKKGVCEKLSKRQLKDFGIED